ncbi:MAG: ATP-binding cassette domain-containing protein, partial [Nevskiales bacterium]
MSVDTASQCRDCAVLGIDHRAAEFFEAFGIHELLMIPQGLHALGAGRYEGKPRRTCPYNDRRLSATPANPSAIRIEDLHKSYGQLQALRGVSFDIRPGEFFGLLGPNGAGKST